MRAQRHAPDLPISGIPNKHTDTNYMWTDGPQIKQRWWKIVVSGSVNWENVGVNDLNAPKIEKLLLHLMYLPNYLHVK